MTKYQISEKVNELNGVVKLISELEYRIKRIEEKIVKSKETKLYIEEVEKVICELIFDSSNLRVDVENFENIFEE